MTNEKNVALPAASQESGLKLHTGGCHCGAVRFQVELDASRGGRCNCSICNKVSQLGSIVKPEAFTLLSGEESITQYAMAQKISIRSFCKHCGIHCFGAGHLAELGGDFVSVNLNTLDDVDPIDVSVMYWDGRHNNWHAGPSDKPWRIMTQSSDVAA
jgi:hypothetical protein